MGACLPERLTPEVWATIDAHRRLGVMDEATYREVVGCYEARARKAYLILLHPDENPEFAVDPAGCINPPSKFRSDTKWRHFRDSFVIPMIEAEPDNPNWPAYLAQVETILAWRAAIPAQDRFWKPDE